MARYIDAHELIKFISYLNPEFPCVEAYKKGWYDAATKISDIIKKDTTADDVRPVVRGEWIKDEVQNHIEIKYHCSKCGYGAWGETEKTNYCPNCGADMRGVEE